MPIKSKPAKKAILAELRRSRTKADELEQELIMQGEDEEAEKVRRANKRLVRRIDALVAVMMRDWLGQSATLQADLRRRNARLQGCIRDVQKKLKVAENVVRATGLIDEAAKLAAVAAGAMT